MRCHSVGPDTPKFRTQSDARSFAVDYMMPVIRVYDESGNVIETDEHAGISKSAHSALSAHSRFKLRNDFRQSRRERFNLLLVAFVS